MDIWRIFRQKLDKYFDLIWWEVKWRNISPPSGLSRMYTCCGTRRPRVLHHPLRHPASSWNRDPHIPQIPYGHRSGTRRSFEGPNCLHCVNVDALVVVSYCDYTFSLWYNPHSFLIPLIWFFVYQFWNQDCWKSENWGFKKQDRRY